MTSVLLGLLIFGYGSLAPGLALAWIMLDEPDTLSLVTVGASLGIFAVPLVHFTIAVMLGTHISPLGITGVSTLLLAACGGLAYRRLH